MNKIFWASTICSKYALRIMKKMKELSESREACYKHLYYFINHEYRYVLFASIINFR